MKQIKNLGLNAVLIEWDQEISNRILKEVLAFKGYLKSVLEKEIEIVSSYQSLLLVHPNKELATGVFKKQLRVWYADMQVQHKGVQQGKDWLLPVCYDHRFGLDLESLAVKKNKTQEEIIRLHTSSWYTVFGIGFLPGFLYLGGLSKSLWEDRLELPRANVEKGAVGIAGKQTGVYPQQSPGGWQIVGNCPVPLFSPQGKPPCFVQAGDRIKFVPIDVKQHQDWLHFVADPSWDPHELLAENRWDKKMEI
ncbi:MAG: 5-oxoprolinase subunit PxpB [Flavobacteriaceae bacterium]|nr:5-oxoprolinase subunit PxpB [Flavobacteriaceae bacterium]